MAPYLDIAVSEASQVGEARRAAQRLAAGQGFDELATGRAALIATELATNLARHARGGRLLLGCCSDPTGNRLELVSVDHGPGMADVARCLRDGFSTAGSQGTGLGAIQRLSSDFSVFSVPGRGSVLLSRLRMPASAEAPAPNGRQGIAWAGIGLAAPGESVCGDGWSIQVDGERASVMLADGLGHGPVAAEAADAALAVFAGSRGAMKSPSAILERAHASMRHTRGAAVALVCLDAQAGQVILSGAGNIACRVVSGTSDRSLPSRNGTLGVQIRKLQDTTHAWPEHSLVVLHSDGITTRWNLEETGGLLQCDPAVVAGWLLRDHARGRDDATVVVLKRG